MSKEETREQELRQTVAQLKDQLEEEKRARKRDHGDKVSRYMLLELASNRLIKTKPLWYRFGPSNSGTGTKSYEREGTRAFQRGHG